MSARMSSAGRAARSALLKKNMHTAATATRWLSYLSSSSAAPSYRTLNPIFKSIASHRVQIRSYSADSTTTATTTTSSSSSSGGSGSMERVQQEQQQQEEEVKKEVKKGFLKNLNLSDLISHLAQLSRFHLFILFLFLLVVVSFFSDFVFLLLIGLFLWTMESRIISSFNRPSKDEVNLHEKDVVERPELEQQLNDLFRAERCYGLVWGASGVGKTSAVIQVIRNKLRPEGIPVFYISAEEGNLKKRLSDGLGVSFFSSYIDIDTELLLDKLRNAAKTMKEKSGHRPVLIIDACNTLEEAPERSGFLGEVQNWAKVQADLDGMNVIFVTSEGNELRTLEKRGARSSRMSRVHVTEASDEEAREYLKLRKGVYDPEEQDRILATTGGAFNYLGKSNLDGVTSDISQILDRHWISPKDPAFTPVFRAILDKGSISREEFLAAFGGDRSAAEDALEGNVFSYDSANRAVTFQNRATRNFIEKNIHG